MGNRPQGCPLVFLVGGALVRERAHHILPTRPLGIRDPGSRPLPLASLDNPAIPAVSSRLGEGSRPAGGDSTWRQCTFAVYLVGQMVEPRQNSEAEPQDSGQARG
jgi:hypothetical protein